MIDRDTRLSRREQLVLGVLVLLGALRIGARELGRALPARPAQVQPLRLDANHATRGELQALPGIGPRTAERIVGGRPYADGAALRDALGQALHERVQAWLRVGAR